MNRSTHNTRAMALTALAMTTLAFNDAIFKHLGTMIPMGEAMTLRGLLLCLIFVAVFRLRREPLHLRSLNNRWCLLRGGCELAATYAFLTSLTKVPIALATTLVFTAPLMLTALSGPLLGERVGIWRWSAVAVGFVGVAVITLRTGAQWDPTLALPLLAAIAVVGRDIATRFAPANIAASTLAFATAIIIMLGGLLSLPFGWQPVSTSTVGWALAAALLIGVSYFAYVKAVRLGDLSAIAPMQYVAVIWATVLGIIVWGEVPDTRTIIGGSMIVAAGIVVLWRERLAQVKHDLHAVR